MSSSVTGFRFSSTTKEQLSALTEHLNQSQLKVAEEAIAQYYQSIFNTSNPVNKSENGIGTRLPQSWFINEHLTEKVAHMTWYVFPQERVVASLEKSSNGTRKWLEVVKEYPQEVWNTVELLSNKHKPVTALEAVQKEIELLKAKDSHPLIIEALAKGWIPDRHYHKDELAVSVNEAEEYLSALCAVNRSEPEIQQVDPDSLPTASEVIMAVMEPTGMLSGRAFMQRYGLTNAEHGQLCGTAKRDGVVVMPDGIEWVRGGSHWNRTDMVGVQEQLLSGANFVGI